MSLRGVFWDVDGTLADTEMEGHRPSFNKAFEDLDLPFYWDKEIYSDLLSIAGGSNRVMRFAQDQGVELNENQLHMIKIRKHQHYIQRVLEGHVQWRTGVRRLLKDLYEEEVQQWIVTSSGRASVQALLNTDASIGSFFKGVISSDDICHGKPAPDGYYLALEYSALNVKNCLALEDSMAGLTAARSAGLPCLITPSPWDECLKVNMKRSIASVVHLGDYNIPTVSLHGPPCNEGMVTVKYLRMLIDKKY